MAKSKIVKANEKIAEGVVGGYKKMEDGAVKGFRKIADKFVDNFLTKENESVGEARIRLAAEQKAREEASAEERRKREEEKGTILKANKQKEVRKAGNE